MFCYWIFMSPKEKSKYHKAEFITLRKEKNLSFKCYFVFICFQLQSVTIFWWDFAALFFKIWLSWIVFLPTDEWHDSWIWTREVWDAETAHQKHTGHFGWHKHKVTENGEGVWTADGIHGRSKVTAIYSWLAVVIVWIFCGGNKE